MFTYFAIGKIDKYVPIFLYIICVYISFGWEKEGKFFSKSPAIIRTVVLGGKTRTGKSGYMAGGTKGPQNQRRGEMPSRSEDAEYPRSSDDPLAVRVKTAAKQIPSAIWHTDGPFVVRTLFGASLLFGGHHGSKTG